MSNSRILRLITGVLELFLAIPVLGGFIIISMAYVPLMVMLVLHLVTLIVSNQDREPRYGSVMGIITSVLAWIPFLGWALHLITGALLLISALRGSSSHHHGGNHGGNPFSRN